MQLAKHQFNSHAPVKENWESECIKQSAIDFLNVIEVDTYFHIIVIY